MSGVEVEARVRNGGKMHSNFCYVHKTNFVSITIVVICRAIPQCKGQGVLLCIAFLAIQGNGTLEFNLACCQSIFLCTGHMCAEPFHKSWKF